MMYRHAAWLTITLLLTVATACTNYEQTAAGVVAQAATPNPILIATAQADQYWRDAEATTQAYQATIQANYQHVQGTAQAATSTTVAQQAQATATTQALQTREALSLALTADAATTQAHETAQAATVQAQEAATSQARQNAVATATTSAVSTAGAFTATRQAFELKQAELKAKREQVVTIASYLFALASGSLLVGLIGWFLWQLIPAFVNRVSIVRYGQHGNPLLVSPQNGRTVVIDPLRMLQAALTIGADGSATMPELTPNRLQAIVTGGVLHTLIERNPATPPATRFNYRPKPSVNDAPGHLSVSQLPNIRRHPPYRPSHHPGN